VRTPHGTSGGPLTPWIVLAVGWSAIAAIWLAWAAGRLTAAVSGHPAAGPDFGGDFAGALIRQDWAAAWPGIHAWLVLVVYVVLMVTTFGGVWFGWTWWLDHRPAGDDPLPSLADARAISSLTLPEVAARARRLRPSLAATPTSLIQPGQAGIALGVHKASRMFRRRRPGTILYSSLEDVIVAVVAPRSGKTTALTAPGILDAPGRCHRDQQQTRRVDHHRRRAGSEGNRVGVRPAGHHPLSTHVVVEPAHPGRQLGGGVPVGRPLRFADPQ
jgi:hypothetical protein